MLLGKIVAFLGAVFSLRASRHLSDAIDLIWDENLFAFCPWHRPDAMLTMHLWERAMVRSVIKVTDLPTASFSEI